MTSSLDAGAPDPLTIRVARRGQGRLRARWPRRIELPIEGPPADFDELRSLIAQYLELPACDIEITSRRRRRHLAVRVHY